MDNNEKKVKETLKSMGFEESLINQAYISSEIKTVEGVLNRIEHLQENPESYLILSQFEIHFVKYK